MVLFGTGCGGGGGGTGTTTARGTVAGSVQLEGVGTQSGSVTAMRAGLSDRTATPGSNGAFSIANMEVGAWTVQFTPGTGHVLADGESGTRAANVAEAVTTTLTPFQIAEAPSDGVVEIHLTAGQTFSPATVTIAPGTTVRWINDSALDHTITPENSSQPGVWQRVTTSTAGVVLEHTFSAPNQTYRYRCEPHSTNFESGMVGTITVTGS